MEILLRKIDENNWEECIQLKVKKEQENFIVSNLYSIAEMQFLPGFESYGIYLNEIMIGFTMFGVDPDDGNYWIYRIMTDQKFQNQGFGKAALLKVIEEIEKKENRTNFIFIGYNPDNENAKRLYKSVGFVEMGIAPWGEMIVKYTIN